MGLDMYLTGRRYLSKHFREGDDKVAKAIQTLFPELNGQEGHWGDDDSVIKEVQSEVGY